MKKNYKGAVSKETKKSKKQINQLWCLHKKTKFWNSNSSFPLYPRTSNFVLSTPHTWLFLISIQIPQILKNFGIFLENFNKEINIVTHSFFFANAQSIYYSHICNKTGKKPIVFHQVNFCQRLMYLQCFHYRSSVIEKQKV